MYRPTNTSATPQKYRKSHPSRTQISITPPHRINFNMINNSNPPNIDNQQGSAESPKISENNAAIFRTLRKLPIKPTRTKNHTKLLRHGLLYTQFKYLSTFKTNDIQLQPTAANSTEPHVNNTETKSTSGNEIPICNEAIFRALRNSRLQLTQFEPEIMPDIWENRFQWRHLESWTSRF